MDKKKNSTDGWTPEKRAAQSAASKAYWAARKSGGPASPRPGGVVDPGKPGPAGHGAVDPSKPGAAGLSLAPDGNKSPGPKVSESSDSKNKTVDANVIKRGLPWLLIKLNRAFDKIAKLVSGSDKVRVEISFDDLPKQEADLDAEIIYPALEQGLPGWVSNHPVLAMLFVGFLNLLGKLNIKKKEIPQNDDEKSRPAADRSKAA